MMGVPKVGVEPTSPFGRIVLDDVRLPFRHLDQLSLGHYAEADEQSGDYAEHEHGESEEYYVEFMR